MIVKKNLLPIFLILIVAAGLRFYNFTNLPFTFDEFSTIFRLNFDNLNDVIQIGMKEMDNHPIGTQVFYYYYTQVFGSGEMAMKLPIILLGIFSVYLVYLIGKKWFNSTAGLYSAAFMAVLQYAVAQSQIARMYGFGIAFVLLMVYFWDKLIHEKFSFYNALGFILSAAICSYNHYFSLLMVIIVGITGLFIVKKADLKKYILSGVVIFLLFVPSINILFYQLSKGGIEGWLGHFEFRYFFYYMSYVFHHSVAVMLTVVIPILFFLNKPNSNQKKYRLITVLLFIMPMLIGFTYSYFFNNVIHERVLYFSFPFLLLFLSSFIKQLSLKKEWVLVIVILMVGASSLVLERKHPQLFTNNRYESVAQSLIKYQNEVGLENIEVIKFTHQKIDKYYNEKNGFLKGDTGYCTDDINYSDFIKQLKNSTKEYLYFGRAEIGNPTYLQIALQYFPLMIHKSYTASGEVYLLKKDGNEFTWPNIFFNYIDQFDAVKTDSNNLNGYISNSEYIGTVEFLLDSIIFSKNNLIELSVSFKQLDSIGGAKLVSSMEKSGETSDWRASELDEFIIGDTIYSKAMITIPIPDIRFRKNTKIKFFVWNPKLGNYQFDNFKIITRPGNPFIYAGTNKIPWNIENYGL